VTATIGGSTAAAACGLDQFKSRVELWAELTGRLERREAGEAALWGTLLEPVIREQVKPRGFVVTDSPIPSEKVPDWMSGNLDGMVIHGAVDMGDGYDGWLVPDPGENKPGWGVYEGKTAGHWTQHHWNDGGAPPAYIIQVHHYMILTGLRWALLACLVAGQRLELREIERDDALCELILQLEGEFMEHVAKDTPPAPDGSAATTEVLKRLYPESTGGIVNLTQADFETVVQLRKVKAARKAAETSEAELENVLKVRLGDNAVGMWETSPVVRWTPVVSKRLDSKALREARPDVFSEFERESSYRRFTVTL
jgi:predicted phage-related endonuclease